MKVDKILELSEKESFDLLKDIEQIFSFLMKMENLPDQLVAVIELGKKKSMLEK